MFSVMTGFFLFLLQVYILVLNIGYQSPWLQIIDTSHEKPYWSSSIIKYIDALPVWALVLWLVYSNFQFSGELVSWTKTFLKIIFLQNTLKQLNSDLKSCSKVRFTSSMIMTFTTRGVMFPDNTNICKHCTHSWKLLNNSAPIQSKNKNNDRKLQLPCSIYTGLRLQSTCLAVENLLNMTWSWDIPPYLHGEEKHVNAPLN